MAIPEKDVSEESGTGAGSATHSGIDYQQRVSAWFLVAMLTRTRISPLLGLVGDIVATTVYYENAEYVDDLHIATISGKVLYLQIKRRLSLSKSETSDWGKTVGQFIQQHLSRTGEDDGLLLVTSPDSSAKITEVVKKLADATRLNPQALEDNPWSKAERKVLDDIEAQFGKLFKQYAGRDMSRDDFIAILKKVYIVIMDVEHGRPHESVALSLIAPSFRIAPELIWGLLVKNSLHYAKSRSSVDLDGLSSTLAIYRVTDDKGRDLPAFPLGEQWKTIIEGSSLPSTGREYILIDSLVPELDLMLVELFRFDDVCNKRFHFTGSTVAIGSDKTESKVWFRGATLQSVERYIDENQSIFKDKNIALMPANGIESADLSPCGLAHAQLIERLLRDRRDLDRCLHCGRALSQHRSYMVELDDSCTEPAVGAVHDECLRPVDRVIGRLEIPFFESYPFLRRFDLEAWTTHLTKGQRTFNELALSKAPLGPHTIVAWNPDNDKYRDFDWCVEVELQDGSKEYLWSRGKLDRFPKAIAETRAAEWNRHIENGRKDKNPHCYTSITKRYGMYSTLLTLKEPDEECLECVKAMPVRYSEQIGKRYPGEVQYYAPLLQLVNPSDESLLVVDQHVVLFTSPLDVPRFLANWRAAGVEVGEYEMRVIGTDIAFDSLMRDLVIQGLRVVVNPLLDMRGSIVQGVFILDLETAKRTISRDRQS